MFCKRDSLFETVAFHRFVISFIQNKLCDAFIYDFAIMTVQLTCDYF